MVRRVADRTELDALLRDFTNYEKMPAFHAGRVRIDLERMREFVERLQHPERSPIVVHVTGTKGKGSTAAFTERLLRARGAPVGLHTSPHLDRIEERIAVDGVPIDDAGMIAATNAILAAAERAPALEFPTFFEWATLTAFLEFRRRGARFAVHEVGLGGRLDATNVVAPAACAITNVDLEHTAILGDTREAIAREKAGIVKPGAPVVTALHPSDPAFEVVAAAAARAGVPIYALGRDIVLERVERNATSLVIDVRTWRGVVRGLAPAVIGSFQADNLALAVGLVDVLRDAGSYTASDDDLRAALAGFTLRGRLEPVAQRPLVIVDGAHTPHSVELAYGAVAALHPHRKTVVLFGMAADKDWAAAAAKLVTAAAVISTGYDHARSAPAAALARAVTVAGGRALVADDARAGLGLAEALAGVDGVVLVVGSFYLAAEVRRAVAREVGLHAERTMENVAWNTSKT